MPRFFLFTLLVLALGCANEPATDPESAETPTAEAGASTGELDIRQVNAAGLKQDIVALDADLTILNVWATWCGPCRIEFPEFVRFGQDHVDQGVAVRFLSVDDEAAVSQMVAFLENNGVNTRTYLSATGTGIVAVLAAPRRWNYGIPATLIFNREGEVVDFWEGAVTYDFLQAKVERLLSEPNEQTASL